MKTLSGLRVHGRLLAFAASLLVLPSPVSAATPLQIAQQAYLKASNTEANDSFAYSVAISGDTVVVGAPAEDSSGDPLNNIAPASGAAYVFVREVTPLATSWRQQAYLKAGNPGADARFGSSVAISDNTVVVGEPGEAGRDAFGAAYVFVRTETTWVQQARLEASNREADDRFGESVAVSGNTVVVGARNESSNGTDQNDNSAPAAGAAYVFVWSGTTWTQQAYLKASNAEQFDNFGISVAVSGDLVIVGAGGEDSNAADQEADNTAPAAGAAYVFVRNATTSTWTQEAYLKASNIGASDAFGSSVAVSGGTVAVGAPGESSNFAGVENAPSRTAVQDDNSAVASGAAYVFVRGVTPTQTTWIQQAYLKASNPGPGDQFGRAVAVSDDVVVVGAYFEASRAIGVNPPTGQTDDSAIGAGAAYVFRRDGTNWSRQAYVKASNTGAGSNPSDLGDNFGYAVGVSGNLILAGAPRERSNATGVNGDQNNNDATAAGAAYVFTSTSSGPSTGPEIVVELQPVGTPLSDGTDTVVFRAPPKVFGGFDADALTFNIRNTGDANLTGLGITIDGPNAGNFSVTESPSAPVSPGNSTAFTVSFSPGTGDLLLWVATLHLASNDSDENPFDITLTGRVSGVPIGNCLDIECTIEWFVECGGSAASLARAVQVVAQNAPANISLGNFYALQSLMNQTAEGRRLTGLYWQHTREIVQIVIASPALALEAAKVLVDFQPAVSALLSGNGSSVQIMQPVIDQLNRVWAGFANVASPALKTALETERARLDGFQVFVGKNFSEWARLLQVSVPAQPYIQAFNPTQRPGLFKVGANYIPGMAYSLWKSANPGIAAWTPVPNGSVRLNAAGVELTDTNAPPTQLFYKVGAQEAVPGQ